jgi:hypothetical protein
MESYDGSGVTCAASGVQEPATPSSGSSLPAMAVAAIAVAAVGAAIVMAFVVVRVVRKRRAAAAEAAALDPATGLYFEMPASHA